MAEDKGRAKIIEICDGVYRLKIPMSKTTGSVNSFLVKDSNGGWIIIDPGFSVPACYEGWTEMMEQLHFGFDDISAILCTHFHGDHAGTAGWFAQHCSAPIYLHPVDIEAYHAEWDDDEENVSRMIALLAKHGLENPERIAELRRQKAALASSSLVYYDSFIPLDENDRFPVEGGTLHTFLTPGHTAGHCMFILPEKNLVFAGDMLLPITYPPVSIKHYSDKNPITMALSTLKMIQTCLPSWDDFSCLPGHGWVIEDPAARAGEELKYFSDRTDYYLRRIKRSPATAYEISEEIAASEKIRKFHLTLSESVAYLEHLRSEGAAQREEIEGIYYYRA